MCPHTVFELRTFQLEKVYGSQTMIKLPFWWLFAVAVGIYMSLMSPAAGARNELASTTSPYLLAHANDAIRWHTWTRATLERASREDKLIFVSIGFLSCHWCHRLARDTFSDPRVSKLINRHFIPILVDRETRPDLDSYYMEIMQSMIGRQGWPANFVLTHDGVPLFVTGYTTPDPSPGDPGLLPVLSELAAQWGNNRAAIMKDVSITREQIKKRFQPPPRKVARSLAKAQNAAARHWALQFDEKFGGFGRNAKFPRPDVLLFLLDHGLRTGNNGFLANVYKTLDFMAAGGVRDQLGGGFHRYAVDRFWQVPHFEIMLNDNALLARLYLRAFQASKFDRFGVVARQILNDLRLRFRLPDGGFASSLGSGTGRQGRDYYTWTLDELIAILGHEEASKFAKSFVDVKHGLVDGRSLLRMRDDPHLLNEIQVRHATSLRLLRAARAARAPPKRDDKMLVSWNAMAASTFALGAKVFDNAQHREIARETVKHILQLAQSPNGLRHSYHQGNASNHVFLDDYAFLADALIDLYELEFDPEYLDLARKMMRKLILKFRGPNTGLFFISSESLRTTFPRYAALKEKGEPSGNAVALRALYRLLQFGDDLEFKDRIKEFLPSIGLHLERSPWESPTLLTSLAFGSDEAHEIVIVGRRDGAPTKQLLREVYKRPVRSTVLGVVPPNAPDENTKWPLLSGRPLLDSRPTAYVCRKRLCDLPVDTAEALGKRLDQTIHPVSAATDHQRQ